MLQHRLSFEAQSSAGLLGEAAYAVDQIPRLATRAVSAGMLVLDLSFCIVICFLHGRGSALPSTGAQMAVVAWLAVPIMLWLAFAYVTALYDPKALRLGRMQLLPALATTCLAFSPSLGMREFAGIGAVAPTAVWTAFLYQLAIVALIRGAWRIILGALLRHGFCLERVVFLARSFSVARVLSASLEHRTKGKLRVAVCAVTPRLGDESTLQWLESVTSSQVIDRIVLADDGSASQQLLETIVVLASIGVDIEIVSKSGATYRLDGQRSDLPRLDDRAPPLSQRQLAVKRAFDICVVGLALLGLVPLLVLIGLLVRLDSKGPALFRQTRQGLNGRQFGILKFRTMHVHMEDPDCAVQTSRADARVTRIGRFLRTSSLDELPQLINVIRGDMSIIGPRPHALGMRVGGKSVASAIDGYEARLRVKPGITGWAQINGSRGEVNAARALRQRVALDCHYIENWSLRMDALIMCRTVALVFCDQGAF